MPSRAKADRLPSWLGAAIASRNRSAHSARGWCVLSTVGVGRLGCPPHLLGYVKLMTDSGRRTMEVHDFEGRGTCVLMEQSLVCSAWDVMGIVVSS